MTAAKSSQEKAPTWKNRNFITKVLIPSLLQPKEGKRCERAPVFPKLNKGDFAITWIGHASFLIQTPKHNILIDPNWANWMSVIRRLRHAGMDIEHLPEIDLVLITHAHFDHLNKRSLKKIASRQPIVVPEGVGGLVHNLGFDAVHEMDRWDTWEFKKLKIIFQVRLWNGSISAARLLARTFARFKLMLSVLTLNAPTRGTEKEIHEKKFSFQIF